MTNSTRSSFAVLVSLMSSCLSGGQTVCTSSVDIAMKSATGAATSVDGGTLVTLEWPAVTTPVTMPVEYFRRASLRGVKTATGQAFEASRFTVVSATRVEGVFSADGGFTFQVQFAEPDRSSVSGCNGQHVGMNDTIDLSVTVTTPGDGGVPTVTSSSRVQLGAG